jgi:hypothetical protein
MEPTESAITFTNSSIDLDNTVLSSEKENCTHEIGSSFPLVDNGRIEHLQPT